jgi:hypothetical protein
MKVILLSLLVYKLLSHYLKRYLFFMAFIVLLRAQQARVY